MKNFSKDQLADVEVYIAEPNEQVREGMRGVLRDYGMRRTRTFGRIADLVEAIKQLPPDLLIAAADLDAGLFDAVRDIRHSRIGYNPFILISLLVKGDAEGSAIKRAILAGADDVMIKPVSPAKMLDRVAHFAMHRQPFIVTNDYLGPERRGTNDRPSKIKQLSVVNTLKATIEGKRMTSSELRNAIESNMAEVMSARLDSHGLKLGWVCGLILAAYREKRIDKELQERVLILVGVLEDAGRTAHALGEPELSQICIQMARQVEELAEDYENPSSLQLATIEKLTKAFELAKAAKSGPASPLPAAA